MRLILILILCTLVLGGCGIAVALIKDGNPYGWALAIFAVVITYQGLKPSRV